MQQPLSRLQGVGPNAGDDGHLRRFVIAKEYVLRSVDVAIRHRIADLKRATFVGVGVGPWFSASTAAAGSNVGVVQFDGGGGE